MYPCSDRKGMMGRITTQKNCSTSQMKEMNPRFSAGLVADLFSSCHIHEIVCKPMPVKAKMVDADNSQVIQPRRVKIRLQIPPLMFRQERFSGNKASTKRI
jgi:hypothetical protein